MRTKTLLLTAALSAAGVATSMAQVYSDNVVGYINCASPAGFSLLANQLNNGSPIDNRIVTLFPAPDEGTVFFKFDTSIGAFISIRFAEGAYEGDDLNMTLNPGEGTLLFSPAGVSVTFVGEVQLVSSVTLQPGFNIASSVVPQSLPVDPDLAFPVGEGDVIFRFDNGLGAYLSDRLAEGSWEGDSGGVAPTPRICEAMLIFNNGLVKNWTRTFPVGP